MFMRSRCTITTPYDILDTATAYPAPLLVSRSSALAILTPDQAQISKAAAHSVTSAGSSSCHPGDLARFGRGNSSTQHLLQSQTIPSADEGSVLADYTHSCNAEI